MQAAADAASSSLVDDDIIHLMEVHAVVFNAPSWCI
jgi:hypothetical protein